MPRNEFDQMRTTSHPFVSTDGRVGRIPKADLVQYRLHGRTGEEIVREALLEIWTGPGDTLHIVVSVGTQNGTLRLSADAGHCMLQLEQDIQPVPSSTVVDPA